MSQEQLDFTSSQPPTNASLLPTLIDVAKLRSDLAKALDSLEIEAESLKTEKDRRKAAYGSEQVAKIVNRLDQGGYDATQ